MADMEKKIKKVSESFMTKLLSGASIEIEKSKSSVVLKDKILPEDIEIN